MNAFQNLLQFPSQSEIRFVVSLFVLVLGGAMSGAHGDPGYSGIAVTTISANVSVWAFMTSPVRPLLVKTFILFLTTLSIAICFDTLSRFLAPRLG